MFYVEVWDHPSTIVPSKVPVSKTEHENKFGLNCKSMSVANTCKTFVMKLVVEIKVNTIVT
jgi:hypothetical protein